MVFQKKIEVFFFSEGGVFQHSVFFFFQKKSSLLEVAFSTSQTRSFASENLSLGMFPSSTSPSLLLFSLPLSHFVLSFFHKRVVSEHVKVFAFSYSLINSSSRKVRSPRRSSGPLVLVLDDLTLRHDELCDYTEAHAVTLTLSLKIVHLPPG